jgi:hypothetical protein
VTKKPLHKILKNKPVNRRIQMLALEPEPFSRRTLQARPGLLRDTPAGQVFQSGNDLDPAKPQHGKSEAGSQTRGARGDAAILLRLANPVAEVGHVVLVVDLIDPDTAENGIGIGGYDNQFEMLPQKPCSLAVGDPVGGLFGGKCRRTPVLPTPDGLHGFLYGQAKRSRVGIAVSSQTDPSGLQVGGVGNDRYLSHRFNPALAYRRCICPPTDEAR